MPGDRIAQLHHAATDVVGADTEAELYRLTVRAAERVLSFDFSYFNVVEGDRFVPVASSPESVAERLRPIPIDHGVTAATLREGRSFLIDDMAEHPVAEPVHGFEGSALSVPVGELGVFQAVSDERAAYTETDLELARLLAGYATETLRRLRSEAELERQNERLDEFASVVSHDLRTPLNVAQGRLELAEATGDPEQFAAVADAHERMGDLLDELLALARQGRVVGDPDDVPVHEVARQAWSGVETGDATLTVAGEASVPADRSRLLELFENLYRNAVEHAGDAPRVTVEPAPDDGGFAVADDGPGIPAAVRDDPFQAGASTAEEGTGFGLAIVKRIAEAHGWSVTVSESDAGGARFEFR